MASAYGPRRTWNAAPGRSGSDRKYNVESDAMDGEDVFDFPESDGEGAAPRVSTASKRTIKKRTPSVKSTTSESDAAPSRPEKSARQQTSQRPASFDFPGSDNEKPLPKKGKHGLSSIPETGKHTERSGKSGASKATVDESRKRKREESERASQKSASVSKIASPKKITSPKQKQNTTLPLGNSKPMKKIVGGDSPRRSQASSKSKTVQSKITTMFATTTTGNRVTRSRSRSQTPLHTAEIINTPTTPKNKPKSDLLSTPSPSRNPTTPTTAMKVGTVTPRQTALWSKLLNTDDEPENLHMSSLRLSKRPISSTPGLPESSFESTELPTPKRVRLVDMLQDSGRPSESDTESDESEEEMISEIDEEVVEVEPTVTSRPPGSQTYHKSKARYGQQRSYIADQDENVIFDMLLEDSARQEFTKSSQRTDFDMESDDDESTQLRSIQDLRAAGSKKRLLDELQSLISGVKGEVVSTLSARRFDLLELVNKLVDPANTQAFLDHGLELQLLESFAQLSDTIFTFLSAACLVCIIKHISNLGPVRAMHRSGWLTRLFELIDLDQDISRIVRERQFNMSKIAQSSMVDFKAVILKPEFWGEQVPEQLTPNILALRAIELLVRRMRELGSDDILLDERSILRLLSYSGREATPEQRLIVLSALESNSIGGHTSRGAVSKSLGKLCHDVAFTLSPASESGFDARNLALRLSLNLTNNNAAACVVFGVSEFVEALMKLIVKDFGRLNEPPSSSPDRIRVIDELILALGAMINIAEINDEARILVLEQDGGTVLSQVVQIFQTGLTRTNEADSVEETQANVPYGYLALLLVNFCQSDRVRTRILSLLPVAQLDRLIQAAEEFIKIFQRTDQEMQAAVGTADLDDDEREEAAPSAADGYANRLMGMVRRLKMVKVES